MRTAGEILFRLRQETANLWLYRVMPECVVSLETPLPGLPDPEAAASTLHGSAFQKEVEGIADAVLAHRLPILDMFLDVGPEIRWRRDYANGIESDTRYFRRIPYLNFERVGDYRVIWEMNRHQYLVAVAQAFVLTGRRDYLAEIERQLTSWIDQNPFQRGLNWTSALEVAFRALSWLWIYHLTGKHMEDRFRRRLVIALDHHGRHIERNLSLYFSPNTHLQGEAVALHALGRLCPALPRGRQWRLKGHEIAVRQAEFQVRQDGSHFEQSAYYHMYALDFFLLHAVLSEPSDFYRETVLRMAEYLAALMGPSRTLPLIGDDDGGRVFHPFGARERFGRATLATCGVLFDRPEWVIDESDLDQQAAWWFGKRAERRVQSAVRGTLSTSAGHPPESVASRLFTHSGMAVMNAGRVQLLMDAGPFGWGSGGHSHSDTLSLVVRLDGEEILIDPGTYTYCDPLWRDRFRGSAAHNTIRVDRRDQSLPTRQFRWDSKPQTEMREWVTNSRFDYAEGLCRYDDIVLRRRVWLDKPALALILDEIRGPDGEHEIEQFWHTGAATAPEGCGFRIGSRVRLLLPTGERAELSEGGDYGWRSPVFACKQSAQLIRVSRKTRLPAQLGAALDFVGDGTAELRLAWSGGKTVFHYRSGGSRRQVTFAESGVPEPATQ